MVKKNNIIVFLMLSFSLFFNESLYSETYKAIQERALTEILDDFGDKYDVFFSYEKSMLEGITSDFEFIKNESAEAALDRLLSALDLSYDIFGDKYIVIYKKTEAAKKDVIDLKKHFKEIEKIESKGQLKVYNQKKIKALSTYKKRKLVVLETVKGMVTDLSGAPLIGASVIIEGTQTATGTTTDIDGNFSLEVKSFPVTLTISYIGYVSQTIEVKNAPKAGEGITITLKTSDVYFEDVVVTAQRRAETLQKVPVSISALSGAQLAKSGIAYTTDLQASVPSLVIAPNAQFGLPYLRGVGTDQITIGLESSVALQSNGVYLPRLVSAISDLYDVERVEVIKGPQGTLFGRNATGGVINVVPNKPTNDFGGNVDLTVGNLSTLRLSAALNAPLVKDKVLFRIAGLRSTGGDFANNPYLDEELEASNVTGLRTQLLINASDQLSIRFFGDYTKDKSSRGLALQVQEPTMENIGVAFGVPASRDIRSQSTDALDQIDLTDYGLGAEILIDLGNVELKSLTSYRKYDQTWALDFDRSELNIAFSAPSESSKSFLQELQLASNNESALKWVLGAFMFMEDPEQDFRAFLGGMPFGGTELKAGGLYDTGITDLTKVNTDAFALFGQLNYAFNDKLSATFGLRYSTETKKIDYQFAALGLAPSTAAELIANRPTVAAVIHSDAPENSWNALTPKFGLEYTASEDVLLFLSATRGFKSGGFNTILLGASPTIESVDEEFIWSYEAGLKSKFKNGRIRTNASLFFYDYTNIQQNVLTTASTIGFATVQNVGDATVFGGELELGAAISSNFFINGQFSYLKTKIDQLTASNPNDPEDVNQDGNELPQAPPFSASIGGDYHISLSDNLNLVLRGEYTYRDAAFNSIFNDPFNATDARGITNLRFTLNDKKEVWSIALYARNLFDVTYKLNGFRAPPFLGTASLFGRPRTFGANLRYNF